MEKNKNYYKSVICEVIKLCRENNRPIVTATVNKAFKRADKKLKLEESSKRQLNEQLRALTTMLSGIIETGVKTSKGEGRQYTANTYFIPASKIKEAEEKVDQYFAKKGEDNKESKDSSKKSSGLSIVPDQIKFDNYLRKLTVQEFKLSGENDKEFPEAYQITRDNYGKTELGTLKLKDLMVLLRKAEINPKHRITTRDVEKTSFGKVKNLIELTQRLKAFKIEFEVTDINQSGHGRRPVEFSKTREVMKQISDLSLKIYGTEIPVPSKENKAERIEISPSVKFLAEDIRKQGGGYKPEIVGEVKQTILTSSEKKIVFYTIGLVRFSPLTIDDILKVFRDNTYNKIAVDNSTFRGIMKKVSGYVNINNGTRVSINFGCDSKSLEDFMYQINPARSYEKFVLISATGLDAKDVPFKTQLEFDYNGIKAWRFSIRKNFHDFKKLANFMKHLRSGDRLIAQDINDSEVRLNSGEITNQLESPIISAMLAHNKISETREFGGFPDKSYVADKALWKIESDYE